MDLHDELRVLYVDSLLSYVRPPASYDRGVAVLDFVNVRVARCVEATRRYISLAGIVVYAWTVDLRHILERRISSYVAIFQINLVQKMLKVALVQTRLLRMMVLHWLYQIRLKRAAWAWIRHLTLFLQRLAPIRIGRLRRTNILFLDIFAIGAL